MWAEFVFMENCLYICTVYLRQDIEMNKLITFIKERIFKIKPIFKVKVEKSWFSKKWYCLKFSKNNGWDWEYILEVDDNYDMPYIRQFAEIKYMKIDSIEGFITNKMQTYEDCVKHNDEVVKIAERQTQINRDRYYKELADAEEIMNRINKKQ